MSVRGENHYNWKGKDASYFAKHDWIRRYFGKADLCEYPTCEGRSTRFEWALLRGKEYEHNRENYWKLCKVCHAHYDGIAEVTRKTHWKHGHPDCGTCGKKLTNYNAKLCGLCNRKQNPYWLGKSRREANLKRL